MPGKVEALGWLARFGVGIQKAIGNYDNRVRKGLVVTGDKLMPWVHDSILSKVKENGVKSLTKREKKIHHYCRKWKADRKKIK